MDDNQINQETSILHKFDRVNTDKNKIFDTKTVFIFMLLILAGALTGYFIGNFGLQKLSSSAQVSKSNGEIKKGQIFGLSDEKTFNDQAEGVLRSGGIDGEGAFHLERDGGLSQYVYLTSSTLDLAEFVGKKVKVWGQTNSAKKAGWLMDVGRLEIIE